MREFVAGQGVPWSLPHTACDSHLHVFGAGGKLTTGADPAFHVPEATIERALRLHARFGLGRGVLVQPSVYGADHTVLADALSIAGPGYRGCATASLLIAASDAEIARLHERGVRGARFSRPGLPSSLPAHQQRQALARAVELGWYARIQPDPAGLASGFDSFKDWRGTLVIDHMGRPDLARGSDDPSLALVRGLLARGNVWVLLTFADRLTIQGPPWDDVLPVARALVEAAPKRCLWGSDWLHMGYAAPPTIDTDVLDFLQRCVPEPQVRHRILVGNPAELFGF